MLDEEFIYRNEVLNYKYLGLKKYLMDLHEKNIHNINLFLLISLEQNYYEGEILKKIVKDLVKLSNNLFLEIDGEKINFKVNKISFDVGDILNRHRWIYRYNKEYMLKYNLKDGEENNIPNNIKKEIELKAYQMGKQEGFNWFKNHCIDAINEILPENNIIDKDFQLNDDITNVFEGNKEIPAIEYICYKHWLEHPKYKLFENALNKIRDIEDSVLERVYNYESENYIKRIIKNGDKEGISNFIHTFQKHSIDYLVDETIKNLIINNIDDKNIMSYYFLNIPMHTTVFNGKKVKNNEYINNIVENELPNIGQIRMLSIKTPNNIRD